MRHAIGVDIGGTNIKAGLVAGNGRIIKKCIVKTEAKQGRARVLANIFRAIEAVNSGNVIGIGVGCPGPFRDIKKGIIGKTPNLPLHNVNLKQAVEKRFRKKVAIDNDANCFVLAEAKLGAAKKSNVVVGLTLGTGVGGGIVISGKIFHGRGNAGELGHIFLNEDFDYYLAERGVQRLCGSLRVRDSVELFELANKGSRAAKEVWAKFGRILGVLIVDIVHTLDPDIVVIGGGISKSWKHFSREMQQEISRKAIFPPCRAVRAKSADSGILGAALLAFRP